MRNLYEMFDNEKEEKRIESVHKQILNDKIEGFYKKIESIKDISDLYNCFFDYSNIIREIINIHNDYQLKDNLYASSKFSKMLGNFQVNSAAMLCKRIMPLYNTDIDSAVIAIYYAIVEITEVQCKRISISDKDIKNIVENNIKKIDNKINLENESNKSRRNYVINEVKGYYAYKLFIQMLMDRLYMESTNSLDKDILDKEIVFSFKILLSKLIEKDNEIIKLPTDVEIHFKEFIKLFVERNNFKETNISNDIPKMTYYIKAKIKDLLDACYREIQGFEYNDDLIEETIYDENIILNKDCENPLTLKIE